MVELFNYTCAHPEIAHWILFTLLLLSGLSLPISEDLVLIVAGALIATCSQDSFSYIFILMYLGVLLGAWETYAIGRIFGPKLYDIRWFKHILTPKKIKKLHEYYEKFGILIFIIIRFCPGGVRVVFYLSAGLGKMPFYKLALRDMFAAALSVPVYLSLGYYFGANYQTILYYITTFSHIIIGILISIGLGWALYAWRKNSE